MLDLILRDLVVIDGSGQPGYPADLGVRDGHIAVIGTLDKQTADVELDAQGLVASPGFIDMHNHSDLSLVVEPSADSHVRQGITTAVIGNCGFSAAPIDPDQTNILEAYATLLADGASVPWSWRSFDQYLTVLENNGLGLNVALLIGHGPVRLAAMGPDNRHPTQAELDSMRQLVDGTMRAGAFGLSSGLEYPPGFFADRSELVALAEVVAEYNGLYASHIRGYGRTLPEAVEEALEIGRTAGAAVQISHLQASGRPAWGNATQALALMDEARMVGVDVTCDVYPYTACATSLSIILPPWVHDGGDPAMLARLDNPSLRPRLLADMASGLPGWDSMSTDVGWDRIVISECPGRPEAIGYSIAELATQAEQDPVDTAFDLLRISNGQAAMIAYDKDEQDVISIMRHPMAMIASDSHSRGPIASQQGTKPHPRGYGTFPRVLGCYVREKQVLTLEEAIHKMTGLPARRLGLSDRGLLQKGMWADIVLFDPDTVADVATYAEPHRYPVGIPYVFINGQPVVWEGQVTGQLAGHLLRHERNGGHS